jgi:hypothetical protein
MKASIEYYQLTTERLDEIINTIGRIRLNIFNFGYSKLQLMKLREKVEKAEFYTHELSDMLNDSIL